MMYLFVFLMGIYTGMIFMGLCMAAKRRVPKPEADMSIYPGSWDKCDRSSAASRGFTFRNRL